MVTDFSKEIISDDALDEYIVSTRTTANNNDIYSYGEPQVIMTEKNFNAIKDQIDANTKTIEDLTGRIADLERYIADILLKIGNK
jgi:hypothetical protein